MISKLKFSFTVFMFISVSPLLWTGLASLILAMLDWVWILALCSIRTLPETKLSQCKAKPRFFPSYWRSRPQKKMNERVNDTWKEYNHWRKTMVAKDTCTHRLLLGEIIGSVRLIYIYIYIYIFFDVCWVLSLSIFTSCAVFWRPRRASQNTNNESVKSLSDTTQQNVE